MPTDQTINIVYFQSQAAGVKAPGLLIYIYKKICKGD